MNYKTTEKLIDLFWKGLSGYSSDVWFDSSSKEKEEILWWALEKLEEPVDREEALDLFWQWADCLEEDSFIDFTLKIPEKLYHATYKQFLDDIKTKGLGNTNNKMWTDSRPGVVYLASEPWEAEDYAEQAEWLDDKDDADEYINNIITLEIDTSKLDTDNLMRDENLLPGGEEVIGFEYHGIIPWSACKIFDSALTESQTLKTLSSDNIKVKENGGRFEIYKDGKLYCTCDNMKEVKDELRELETNKNKYKVTWAVIEKDDSVNYKSEEVEAVNEEEAINIIKDKNAFDKKAIKLEAVERSLAEEFKIYENLWD